MSYLRVDHSAIADQLQDELPDIQLIQPTGSSYTCDPPVVDTDIDFICYVESLKDFEPVAEQLLWAGGAERKAEGSMKGYPDTDFKSFRKEDERGSLNIIVTDKKEYYESYVLATKLAKKYNLLSKHDRCELFEAVLYGKLDNKG